MVTFLSLFSAAFAGFCLGVFVVAILSAGPDR